MKNYKRRTTDSDSSTQCLRSSHTESAWSVAYPAIADAIDLPELTFCKSKDEDTLILSNRAEWQSLCEKNTAASYGPKTLDGLRLMGLLAWMWPGCAEANVTVHIIARRDVVLKLKRDGTNVVLETHWSLFVPHFSRIKELPIIHPDVLGVFADAVFHYAAVAMKHPGAAKNELESLLVGAYLARPELLLASLDIFNKPGIYHVHPQRTWANSLSAANDAHRLEIDVSAAAASPLVTPEFLENVGGFIHSVVKGYAFRYVDYVWTQRYRIIVNPQPDTPMVAYEGRKITVNIHPLIDRAGWKPALYLSLGHAIMLAILEFSGGDSRKSHYLSMMKTWNRYLSFGEFTEQQNVRTVCGLPEATKKEMRRSLLEYMTGREGRELVDDFVTLTDLNESRHPDGTVVRYDQMWEDVRNLNTAVVRNNISYAKLIEVLRNDNIDHMQVADLLLTGRLGGRNVVDVSEWLLLRTLIYDLINAPKVFRNDYKMLLKVLTKVNKSLIIYIWTLILTHDARCEPVNTYISRLITDIFVFDRVKIYEIVAEPLESLEAEAVTGYLLNWAGLSLLEWRSIIGGALSRLSRDVVRRLTVRTPGEVDQLVGAMTIRASGLIGFYLHQAYRWGSTQDEVTERIRSHFPELLKQAKKATLPHKMMMGGAMLLLILAQIISDERDGFARNVTVTEEDRACVLSLIKQCVDWHQQHFVIMVGGIATGYTGRIDGWVLQQFDALLARYGGGDRIVLRSVVQFDVETLIERALMTAKAGDESGLMKRIQLLRLGVDPIVSNRANKCLKEMAIRYGIQSPEALLKKRDIRMLVLELSRRMKTLVPI